MEIPTYQIHKVMRVYTKQLTESKLLERSRVLGGKSSMDQINISTQGKRQAIIDQVAADIVDRITNFGPRDEIDQEIVDKLESEIGQKVDFNKAKKSDFVYNTFDEENGKTTSTISVDDSRFLINRLEDLAKEAVNRNMEA
jgi:thymidine kinase